MASEDRQRLEEAFARELVEDVRLSLFTGAADRGRHQALELLRELASLSPRISLAVHDCDEQSDLPRQRGIDPTPAILLEGRARGSVRFFGLPSGYEFPSLIAALVDVSRGETSLSETSREDLARIGRAVHVRVFTTST